MLNKFYLYIIFSYLLKLFALPDTFALPETFALPDIKAGESQSRAPGQASDYTLRAPNPLDSIRSIHDQTFYQDFGAP